MAFGEQLQLLRRRSGLTQEQFAEELRESYSVQELPRSREEFENRAMLYHIMEDMRVFLEIKREFAGACFLRE